MQTLLSLTTWSELLLWTSLRLMELSVEMTTQSPDSDVLDVISQDGLEVGDEADVAHANRNRCPRRRGPSHLMLMFLMWPHRMVLRLEMRLTQFMLVELSVKTTTQLPDIDVLGVISQDGLEVGDEVYVVHVNRTVCEDNDWITSQWCTWCDPTGWSWGHWWGWHNSC